MILETINILKLSSRSLLNRWHLLDSRSHSFMQADNEIQNPPALDCLAKDDRPHAHVSQFLSSQGRVNDPTPVLSDTCFSQPIRWERETLLAWNKSGPYLRNHNTTHLRVCECVSALSSAKTDGWLKLKLKETIPSHLDERDDQGDWVSLRNSYLFCLENLILSHQMVIITTWELRLLYCFADNHILVQFNSLYSLVSWRETPILLSCNETPCEKSRFLRKGCFAEETDTDSWNTHTYTRSGDGDGSGSVSAGVITNLEATQHKRGLGK